MSTQPLQMPTPRPTKEDLAKAKRREELRSDLLYIGGSLLVTVGVGMYRLRFGFITAGAFCLLMPLLQLAGSFIRGVKAPPARR